MGDNHNSKERALRAMQLTAQLMDQGTRSVNQLFKALRAQGLEVSKAEVSEYRRRALLHLLPRAATEHRDVPAPMQIVTMPAEEQAARAQRVEARLEQLQHRQVEVPAEAPAPPPISPEAPVSEPEPKLPEVTTPKPKVRPINRNAMAIAERRQYLNTLLDEDPGLDPFVATTRLREKFGAGLGMTYIYDTCRVAREIHGLPTLPRRTDPHGRAFNGQNPLPTFPAPETGVVVEPVEGFATTPEEDMQWLARQAADIMRQHNLVQLVLTVDEKRAEYETKVAPRMVRGSLDL